MNDHDSNQRGDEHQPGPDGAFIINGPAQDGERDRAKKKRAKQIRRDLQLVFNGSLAMTTCILALITTYQACIAKNAMDAARVAAKVAKDTLTLMKTSGEESANQATALIGATKNLATAATTQSESMRALAERALAQAKATNTLAAEAKRAGDIAQQRELPWVGIEDSRINLVDSPSFASIMFPLHPNTLRMRVSIEFSVKNFGTAPAFYEIEMMAIEPVTDPRKPGLRTLDEACSTGMSRMQQRGEGPPTAFSGIMMPGARRESALYFETRSENHVAQIGRSWIDVCVTYQDASGGRHYSGYRFITTPDRGQPIPIPRRTNQSYVPFTGASLVSARAN